MTTKYGFGKTVPKTATVPRRRMPGGRPRHCAESAGRARLTLRLIVPILVFTALLAAVKYWVVSRYLLGH